MPETSSRNRKAAPSKGTTSESDVDVRGKEKLPHAHSVRSYIVLLAGILGSFLLVDAYKNEIAAYRYAMNEGLHHPIYPTVAVLVYLLVVYDSIPRFMKDRAPMKCTAIKAIHNYLLTVFSFVTLFNVMREVGRLWFSDPDASVFWRVEKLQCDSANVHKGSTTLYFWFHLYYLSKYWEMLDTVFICLTKKKPIFLHCYHHLITLWTIWVGMHEQFAAQWVIVAANCLIHVFMYYYYLQQTLGFTVWWKRYLTALQIVQFVLDELSILSWAYFVSIEGIPCAARWFSFWYAFSVISSFLVLFSQFYLTTYRPNTTLHLRQFFEFLWISPK